MPYAPIGISKTARIWMLDVVFNEDLTGLRSAHGPQNMAAVKHMRMNFVPPKDEHSLKVRRKLANLNPRYLHALITQNPPLT